MDNLDPNPEGRCPDVQVLHALSAGRLDLTALEAIADHVAMCHRCAQALSGFDETGDALLAALRQPADPDPLSASDCAALVARVEAIGTMPKAAIDTTPQMLGRYQLLAKAGEGGMGSVYKAMHVNLGKVVALKTLSADRVKDAGAVARLQREMKAVGALHHPNIVGAHDADEIDGVHFLVMEYVEGIDVGELARRVGPLEVADACELVRQAAIGLEYAHRRGLVHRDVKPSNLMLDGGGQVKVLDLGLALLASAEDADELTSAGSAMGTADYMAPEQAGDSHLVDGRADVYSLGCTLFKLLIGHPPFPAPRFDTTFKKMTAHTRRPPPAVRDLRPDVPASLDAIVARALAKKPEARFASAGELAEALAPLARDNRLAALFASTMMITQPGTIPPPNWADVATNLSAGSPEITTDPTTAVVSAKRSKPSPKRVRVVRTVLGAVGLLLVAAVVLAVWNRQIKQSEDFLASTAATVEPQPVSSLPPAAVAPFNAQQARAHQEAWAKYLDVPIASVNLIGMTLVLIPPGEFLMGSTAQQNKAARELSVKLLNATDPYTMTRLATERPQHRVAITKPYWLGDTEVTTNQFKAFVDATGYVTDAERFGFGNSRLTEPDDKVLPEMKKMNWRTPGYAVTGDSPVTQVTWNDAIRFCNWLSIRDGLQSCYREDARDSWVLLSAEGSGTRRERARFGYRLPTEAEWEYACRAGTTTHYSFGDDSAMLADFGWFNTNCGGSPRAVGMKAPNPFGLFDLHGNVYEWCQDRYAANYYQQSPATDPTGPAIGPSRVTRGGYWSGNAVPSRSAFRLDYMPLARDIRIGFRVVRVSARGAAPAVPSKSPAATVASAPSPAKAPSPAIAPFDAAQARRHQDAWAAHLHTTVDTANPVGMRLILIPPGEFSMGSTPEQNAVGVKMAEDAHLSTDSWEWRGLQVESPQHRVTITRPFWLGLTEVTIDQFKKFIRATKYMTEAERFGFGDSSLTVPDATITPEMKRLTWRTPGYVILTDEFPVTQVTWNDAVAFCNWLSEQEQREPCYGRNATNGSTFLLASAGGYRLPTEAEWEYACRAGTNTQFSFGDDPAMLDRYGWFNLNSTDMARRVGLKLPNPFGLFDMHGDVREWCQDFFASHYYSISPAADPLGPAFGSSRILRGGYWSFLPLAARSAARSGNRPTYRGSTLGFRVLRVSSSAAAPAVPIKSAAAQAATVPSPANAPFDAAQARQHQAAWAAHLHMTVGTTSPAGMRLVLIPPGEFSMGSTPEQSAVGLRMAEDAKLDPHSWDWQALQAEVPQHRVTISRPFWLGLTEVTVGQFKQFVEMTRYVTEAEQFGFGEAYQTAPDDKVTPEMKHMTWRAPGYLTADDSSVTQVTWNDAVQFCNWLSEQERRDLCYRRNATDGSTSLLASADGYRLPTEAEWEYACRAGTTTQFSFGDDPAMLDDYGWFNLNSTGVASRVGLKLPNPFGLFDMHGNVREWCHDFYSAHYYSSSPAGDPLGPPNGSSRILRGGYWSYLSLGTRSAARSGSRPTHRARTHGFRVLRVQ